MKLSIIRTILSFCLTSIIVGVAPMAAVTKSIMETKWIDMTYDSEVTQISFPHKPFELKFNVPFKNTSESGKLHIYSTPLEKEEGLLVFSILKSPYITDKCLDKKQFKENFTSYLVNYLFNEPQTFKNQQTYSSKLQKLEDLAVLSFEFTYEDKQVQQLMKGVAIVHHDKLYQLFYLAPEEKFNTKILHKFVESFIID